MSQDYKKTAVIISAALILLAAASVIYLLVPRFGDSAAGYIAEIYQDGRLLYSIPLNEVSETDSFLINGTNGCINQIEVRPGSIGIVSADCPDKLCVRQGFITDTKLPVVCLPNRLVIRLRPAADDKEQNSITPDAVTY